MVAMKNPRAGEARVQSSCKEINTMSYKDTPGPSGLTDAESEEIHRHLIQGTQIFGMIAALAHLLAFIYSPWLK
jgi:light-harvesting protein B-800-850 beta chain